MERRHKNDGLRIELEPGTLVTIYDTEHPQLSYRAMVCTDGGIGCSECCLRGKALCDSLMCSGVYLRKIR